MYNYQKEFKQLEVLNAINQLDEKNSKGYLYSIYSLIDKNDSNLLLNELEKIFHEIVYPADEDEKCKNKSCPSNYSTPRRSLNIPLADVGLSNGQKRLKAENERLLGRK